MLKTITKLGDIKIEKQKFHQHKRPFSIKIIDITEIVVSNKISFGKNSFEYFIGYKDSKRLRTLFIFLPKMGPYRRDLDKTKYMFILIKDDELLEKYNEIWEKIKNSVDSADSINSIDCEPA